MSTEPSVDPFDLQKQVSLYEKLKDQFPDYFNNHPGEQEQSLLSGAKQCKAILEGIGKRYKLDCSKSQPGHEAKGYQILTSVDNGDCLYDAIWQGPGEGHRRQLFEKYCKEIEELKSLPNYHVLKIILLKAIDESEEHRKIIMGNKDDPTSTPYAEVADYKLLVNGNGIFWGRHNVEGEVLAKVLGLNLLLIGGYDYIYEFGFVERDDEVIHKSDMDNDTVYISNNYQHYSPVRKCETAAVNESPSDGAEIGSSV